MEVKYTEVCFKFGSENEGERMNVEWVSEMKNENEVMIKSGENCVF